MRRVDSIVATVDNALAKKGLTTKSLERWKAEMPTEEEMRPKDKYTMFDRKVKGYRKGVHSMSACARLERNQRQYGRMLTCLIRIAKVDESIAKTQSAWLLRSLVYQYLRHFRAIWWRYGLSRDSGHCGLLSIYLGTLYGRLGSGWKQNIMYR
jgi:hypothetical protein